MIQGFNQGGQRAVDIITMQLTMEDMVSSALFHIIDAKTSYNMLLDHPWLHENAVVPSTWHQCFKYCRNDANKGNEVLPLEEPKSCNNQNTRKNDSSTLEVELLKGLTLPLTQINMKQPFKLPLKGFVPLTQEGEGGHEALAIDEKGFDPKAFKLLIKARYDPKEKLSLGKLLPETTGLGFTPPKPVRIAIKRVNSNYVSEGFSSTEDHKREENLREFVFNGLGPHRKELQGIANKQSVFDRLGPYKRVGHQKKCAFKVTVRSKKNIKSSHTQKLRSLIPSGMKRQTTLTVSCGRVLKAKAQTVIFTQVQSDDEDDKESVASPNYISNGTEENIPQTYHITLIEDGEVEEEDVEDAPAELEEGIKATIDELKEVNLGDIENPRPIYISASLTQEKEGTYIALLHKFKDVFAWSYKEMPGLDPKVAVHHLSVKKGARLVKQGQCRFRPELIPLIEGEMNKLIAVGFIREVKYPMWISSIVPVRKKNWQIRVCVDFRDLNNSCPKVDFPLPIVELTIDSTTSHDALSFMDGSSGYNQLCMAPADEELTIFHTPKGILLCERIPAPHHQRAMRKIFDGMLHKNVECYVDDLVVKSKKRENHFHD
ncbi:UNVERIFIED_CONTAM: hypothetical protein Scaly_2501000 [Sesamum calycinum]|uniref:Reverse transcriptase domain-containing protein n=1 Tax=Sesamum calycinum TaxID=2727403 RepID=A0AAW2LW44_9LAMI